MTRPVWQRNLSAMLCAAVRAVLAGSKAPRVPDYALTLWNAFCALSAARRHHAAGPEGLAPSDVLAWVQLTRTPLLPHHVGILMDMDRAYLAAAADALGGPERGRAVPLPVGPLTPAALDAMFG